MFPPETVIMEHQEAGYTDGNVNPTQFNSIRKKASYDFLNVYVGKL